MPTEQKHAVDIRGLAPLLQVFDMPASLHFYRDIMGFEVAAKSDDGEGDKVYWVLMKHGNVEFMLNEMYECDRRPSLPDEQRTRAHYDTSIYFGCSNVDAAYKHFTAKGVDLKEPVITKYNFWAIYVKDPDGYLLVFHWPVG